MKRRNRIKSPLSDLCLALILLTPGLSAAETLYVTDTLRLSLYAEPRGNADVVKLMTSGDALEVLEKQGAYARVRTTQGEEGWAKLGFLVAEKPAVLIVEERDAARERVVSLEEALNPASEAALRLRRGLIAAGTLAAVALLGFLIGLKVMEGRVRRRFGGIKVW